MIPRYQVVLFSLLLLASTAMGVFLWQMRSRAHQRMIDGEDATSTSAPEVAPAQQATLYVASDADNTLVAQSLVLPLPATSGPRARVLLGRLLDLYAASNAPHPVQGGAASVAQVFLMPLPVRQSQSAASPSASAASESAQIDAATDALLGRKSSATPSASAPPSAQQQDGPQLAVVNLTGAFANAHPSGLEAETLTILSICATLHANIPNIAEVRFLVDGAPRATLAGHADLARTYLADQTAPTEGIHP